MSLDAAIISHKSSSHPDYLLFARECAGGLRSYVSMHPQRAWEETKSKQRTHLYEVLSGPCSLYLDIEWIESSTPSDEENRIEEICDFTKDKLKTIYNCCASHTAVTASGRVKKGYKCSWHLHFHTPDMAWENAAAVGDFVREHLSHFKEVDLVPYNSPTQNWRCVGSSKVCDPNRVFLPCSSDHFFNCIVQKPAKNIIRRAQKTVTKVFNAVPEIGVKVAKFFKNARQNAVHMSHDSTRYMIVPFKRQRCPIAERVNSSNH